MRDQMRDQQQRHEQEMKQLQTQIDELKQQSASAAAPASAPALTGEEELESALAGATAGPATPQAKPAAGGISGLGGAIQSFNPDISINGDFLGTYSSKEGGQTDDEFQFRELEIGLSAPVDAYTNANAIITFGQEDNDFKADLEEGYVTFTQLPYDLQARVGKFRSEFGKVNSFHRHAIPWIDYPLVIQNYFGDEGLSGTGAELSWLVPHTGKQYVSLTYQITNNDNDTLFAGEKSDDFMHLVHLKTFRDLSPTSNLEIGASIAEAPNDGAHGGKRSTVEGVDVTYHWKPKEAGLYRALLLQAELLAAQADLRGGQESTWGMYMAGDYQFARRWKFGMRYDYTQLPFSSSRHETGYSAYLTFLQSEFLFWRLGYLFTDRNFRQDGNTDEQQVFLQLNWTYGIHPAHKF